MLKRYKEKEVKALVARLKEEYEGVVRALREEKEELKEENRLLSARLSVLESQRSEVSVALMRAVKEGERIKEESSAEAEGEKKELLLLAEKCRLLSERLLQKYPDEEDVKAFAAFNEELNARLGGESEESGFNMDDVLSPKEPLDLEKLCKDLGLMEDDE